LSLFFSVIDTFNYLILWKPLNVIYLGACARMHFWGQFHQCFTCSFYACRSQKRKKIQLSHQYLFTLLGSACVKAVFTPGLNFINILCTAFTLAEPISIKNSQVISLFTLLGSTSIKAERKYVDEIDT
jgi:hypothetical protein